MKANNCSQGRIFLMPLVQAPIFMSFFLAIRNMAQLPIESMKTVCVIFSCERASVRASRRVGFFLSACRFARLALAHGEHVLRLRHCVCIVKAMDVRAVRFEIISLALTHPRTRTRKPRSAVLA